MTYIERWEVDDLNAAAKILDEMSRRGNLEGEDYEERRNSMCRNAARNIRYVLGHHRLIQPGETT